MYRSFYRLKEKPFQITTDPRFLWLGEKHKEGLSILKYGILDNKWFLLLTGDVGTGKTTLINALLESLDDSVLVATVPDPGLDELDLFNVIADLYGLDRTFSSKGEFLIDFRRFLNEAHEEGKKILLIIDEAQRLNQERLEVIRLLSNIERQETKLINIFFVGQNEFNDTLRRPENRALRQRITINYNISPLTADETGEYIAHRLKVAGADHQIFHPEAIRKVATYTGGYPRLINVLCDYGLVTGYVKGARLIMPAVIDECARELHIPWEWPVTPPATAAQAAAAGRPETPPVSAAERRVPFPERQAASRASEEKRPVKVVKQQARMPSREPTRRTGLYVACLLVLVLGAVLYFMPGGLDFLSGMMGGSSGTGAGESQPTVFTAPAVNSGGQPAEPETAPSVTAPENAPQPAAPSVDTANATSGTAAQPADEKDAAPVADLEQTAVGEPQTETAASTVSPPLPGVPAQPESAKGATEPPLEAPAVTVQRETTETPPQARAEKAAPVENSPASAPGRKTPAAEAGRAKALAQVPASSPPQAAETDAEASPAETPQEREVRRLAHDKRLIIYFGRNSNEMQQNTFAKLDALSVFMRRHPDARLVIRGYTDSSGVYSYNKKLSEFRANMVKSYLVGKGTDPGRIQSMGMGPSNPLKSNAAEKTRRFNRRVEIDILMGSD